MFDCDSEMSKLLNEYFGSVFAEESVNSQVPAIKRYF